MLNIVLPLVLAQSVAAADTQRTATGTPDNAPARLEVVEVRATARQMELGSIPGIATLDSEQIAIEAATHPNELFDRTPGTWVSRGSGQESLISIRSPVLTGPGACGAFMILEDRVPIRPAGFCNVNGLFEVNLLQARRVDVVRGPGSAIYGSNALHGVIDVSSGDPTLERPVGAGVLVGTDDYYRLSAEVSGASMALLANWTDAGSFREDEGFTQGFANGVWTTEALGADVRTQFSWADLDQDTAGFIFGEDAYQDPVLRRQNLNPEAFRTVQAFRASSRWLWSRSDGPETELIPYVRRSDMDFLQHFLPGKPLEQNGQDSAGVLFSWTDGGHWRLGLDVEWADGYLIEFQENPTEGSEFLMETRPQGFHYDYDVTQLMGAAWVQYQRDLGEFLTLTAGLRAELIDYGYTNNMLDGNTRDDGTACGFGGCLYTRPSDRSDSFDNLAPELGLRWRLDDATFLLFRVARGFRPPQATELYRLQRGQTVAELDSETLDSIEVGVRQDLERLRWDVTGFLMRKKNSIFRDANGFNVSDGETDSMGLEASFDWQFAERWSLGGNVTWANHEYAFDRPASGIVRGNTVDTAPEWLAGTRLRWDPAANATAELEWVHQGDYFIDPSNLRRYEGHDLLHLRGFYRFGNSGHQLNLRVTNLLNDLYAERADFAFGNFRYFPGAERRYFLEWRYLR
ncbi:MAG: TonB-dependent receptor [Xanthomonadales bacterium]|jgi:outer membrane receptor protein involved in Fe transport|nr:TonB-dependent receptor [Xanthomonadales bacterium]